GAGLAGAEELLARSAPCGPPGDDAGHPVRDRDDVVEAGFVDVEAQGRDGAGIRVLSAGTAAGTRRGPPLPAGLLRGQVLAPHSRQVESLVLLRVLLRGIH